MASWIILQGLLNGIYLRMATRKLRATYDVAPSSASSRVTLSFVGESWLLRLKTFFFRAPRMSAEGDWSHINN